MSITRRSLLKALGIAPAVAAGVATAEPVAVSGTCHECGAFIPEVTNEAFVVPWNGAESRIWCAACIAAYDAHREGDIVEVDPVLHYGLETGFVRAMCTTTSGSTTVVYYGDTPS